MLCVLLLSICLLTIGQLAVSQILPKFSGIHSRNNDGDAVVPSVDRPGLYEYAGSSLSLSGVLSGLLSPLKNIHYPAAQEEEETSVTIRLSVLPSIDNSPVVAGNIAGGVSTVDEVASIQLARRLESVLWRGERMLSRSQFILAENLFKDAIQDVTEWTSVEGGKSVHVNQQMTGLLTRMAIVLYTQSSYRDALNALSLSVVCFDRSTHGKETSADVFKRAKLVSNMGSIAMQDENFAVAVIYFHDVLLKLLGNSDERDTSSAVLIGKTYTRLGGVYLALNDIPQSIYHFNEGAAVLRSIYHPETMQHADGNSEYVSSLQHMFADYLFARMSSCPVPTTSNDTATGLAMSCDCTVATPDEGVKTVETTSTAPSSDECACDSSSSSSSVTGSGGSVLSEEAADRIRHVVVGFIALMVTGSGLLALFPVHNTTLGCTITTALPEHSVENTPRTPMPYGSVRGNQQSLSQSKVRRSRRKITSGELDTCRGGLVDISQRLSKKEESTFSALEGKAVELLRDMAYHKAETFLTRAIHLHFPSVQEQPPLSPTGNKEDNVVGGDNSKTGAADRVAVTPGVAVARGIVESRLRYLLSKALIAVEKFQEGEHELHASIDAYLKLGVLDDVAVAALLDYSLVVIRDQLYDENGDEKYTPDRFVRAHNVFCSLLFGPSSSSIKALPFQRFQLSGPVDAISVQAYGLMSPPARCTSQMMSMSRCMADTPINSPMAFGNSPIRSAASVRTNIKLSLSPTDTEEQGQKEHERRVLQYDTANDMLKSLEKVFYRSQKRKDEMTALELMCSEFEDLADAMDKCLNTEDFSICVAPRDESELCLRDSVADICNNSIENIPAQSVVDNDIMTNVDVGEVTLDQDIISELNICPHTNTCIATVLGSTTGDDFDGDTFDDLLLGPAEEGDVSRVNMVKLNDSTGSPAIYSGGNNEYSPMDFSSPQHQQREGRYAGTNNSASFESPVLEARTGAISTPYLHLRHGIALHSSEMKENNHSGSMAGTDGYISDHSNTQWGGARRGNINTNTGGRKKRKKHQSPGSGVNKPIR